MSSHIEQSELLSDEVILAEKMAGAFIKLSDFSLRSLSYLNWAGTEKIGGKLHLTNYRLIFASNKFNRVTGKFSIFLPTIQEIKNTSFLLDRRIEIQTKLQAFEFQVWGIPELTKGIISARDHINATARKELAIKILQEYPKLGEEFGRSEGISMILERAASLSHFLDDSFQPGNSFRKMLNSEDPPTVSSLLNVLEVLGGNNKTE